jgi:hypothetical protein
MPVDERLSLIQHSFRQILSLASIAYTFTALHTIQYAMSAHDDDNTTTPQDATDNNTSAQIPPDNASIAASSNNASSTSRWNHEEIQLLLDYVEANCTLTSSKGINLKKSEFSQAHNTVKTKTATQCHYKWGSCKCIHY